MGRSRVFVGASLVVFALVVMWANAAAADAVADDPIVVEDLSEPGFLLRSGNTARYESSDVVVIRGDGSVVTASPRDAFESVRAIDGEIVLHDRDAERVAIFDEVAGEFGPELDAPGGNPMALTSDRIYFVDGVAVRWIGRGGGDVGSLTVDGPSRIRFIGLDRDDSHFYVTNWTSDTMFVVRLGASPVIEGSFEIPFRTHEVGLIDGDVLLSYQTGELRRFGSGQPVDGLPLPSTADSYVDGVLSSDGRFLVTHEHSSFELTLIDVVAGEHIGSIPIELGAESFRSLDVVGEELHLVLQSERTRRHRIPLRPRITRFDVDFIELQLLEEVVVGGLFVDGVDRARVSGRDAVVRSDGAEAIITIPTGVTPGSTTIEVYHPSLERWDEATIEVRAARSSAPFTMVRFGSSALQDALVCLGTPPPGMSTGDLVAAVPSTSGRAHTVIVPVGAECSIEFGEFGSMGFFDPLTDPLGDAAFDVHPASDRLEFTMPPQPAGVRANLVADVFVGDVDVVLWVYTRADGRVPAISKRLRVECDGQAVDLVEVRYRTWTRFVIPNNPVCVLWFDGGPPDRTYFAEIGADSTGEFTQIERYPVGDHRGLDVIVAAHLYPHPLLDAEAFVAQSYEDILGREAEGSALAGWSEDLRSGRRSATDLVTELVESDEFGGRFGSLSRLYRAYFGRYPDEAGLRYWLDLMQAGVSLEAISSEFAASAEFRLTYGALGDDGFVDLVYGNVLGRSPDSSGRSYWRGLLDGGLSRGGLMIGFSESQEYRLTTDAEVIVSSLYIGLLRRQGDDAGMAYWIGQRRAGASVRTLIDSLLFSEEYERRFADVEDPITAGARSLLGLDGRPIITTVGSSTAEPIAHAEDLSP